MIQRFDHVTVVVTDLEKAKGFFGLLGFEEALSVVISGEQFSRYMDIEGIEAHHITLVHAHASPRLEVQLLKYHHPDPMLDPHITARNRVGFNHVCFAVDDLDAELKRLEANGVTRSNDVMEFHDRKLVFLPGPEGITIEPSQWH